MLNVTDKKHIDALVARHEIREAELKEIGDEIRKSARTAAVAFIDLSDSTALKEMNVPETWLGYVYRFIRCVEKLVVQFNGTVVKRIGDEVLATFESVQQCEEFLTAIESDEVLRKYEFKAAVDFGEVFFLKFQEHLEDDPYGPSVDRCARIAKLAKTSTVLASAPYRDQLGDSNNSYIRVGPIRLAGITRPQEVYVRRPPVIEDLDGYLSQLLSALNHRSMNRPHYHSVARAFSREYFEIKSFDRGCPFLLRELLNVPKLPLSMIDFLATLTKLEHEDDSLDYIGYFVEWEGQYSTSDANILGDCLTVFVKTGQDAFRDTVVLRMPLVMTDVIRSIVKGTFIRFRGIIVGVDLVVPMLDYVDIEIPTGHVESTPTPTKRKRLW